MSQNLKPIGVRDWMGLYNNDPTLFEFIPEFNFLEPVSKKAKSQNCTCGMSGEIYEAILTYNGFVQNLSEDTVNKIKQKFQLEKACFVVQTSELYEVKCY